MSGSGSGSAKPGSGNGSNAVRATPQPPAVSTGLQGPRYAVLKTPSPDPQHAQAGGSGTGQGSAPDTGRTSTGPGSMGGAQGSDEAGQGSGQGGNTLSRPSPFVGPSLPQHEGAAVYSAAQSQGHMQGLPVLLSLLSSLQQQQIASLSLFDSLSAPAAQPAPAVLAQQQQQPSGGSPSQQAQLQSQPVSLQGGLGGGVHAGLASVLPPPSVEQMARLEDYARVLQFAAAALQAPLLHHALSAAAALSQAPGKLAF